ncbi:MAG: tol-pal system YbgF family protein [Gemmatimonadota bacterium]
MGRPPLWVGVFALVAAGCATKADVQTLESSMVEEMSQIRDDQVQVVERLQSAVDGLDAAMARRAQQGEGEMDRRVQRLESSLSELLDITLQNNQLLNDLLTQRPASLGVAAGAAGAAAGRASGGAMGGAQSTDDATQFYALALEEFRKGNLETARGALEEFLARNPTHQLAPDAQYHIGRTYEDAGEMALALTEYQRVTELFPDSNRAPTALWRRGLIEVARGNTAAARRLFTQISTGYPNSPELTLAQRELAKLGN